MPTQWPLVKNALVATWQQAIVSGSTDAVYDGVPVTTDTPLRWVTVGWVQDSVTGAPAVGRVEQRQNLDGFQTDETGTIDCEITAQSGDPNPVAVMQSAFDFLDVLTAAIKKSRTLGGVLSPNGTVDIAAEPIPETDASGTVQRLHLSVTYTTTTL